MSEFSVLISVYEKEKLQYLKSALQSLIDQTLAPSEIVLVQDGPLPSNLLDFINEFKTLHPLVLSTVTLKENIGLGLALKIGLETCRFELVARMDTDDICYPSRFEKQISFMEAHPHVSVVGSSIQEFNVVPGDLNQFKDPPTNFEDLKRFSKFRNPLNHPSVLFRKSHVINAGSYQHMPLFEDYFLWVRMLQLDYRVENLDEPLLHFRTGNDMIGRRHGLAYLKKEFNFLKAIKKLGFISSIEFISSISLKLPLRLLPKALLEFLYKKTLR